MLQPKAKIFKRTCIAAAILSLSACSSMPNVGGIDMGSVGSGISKAGKKTMEISSNAWDGTKRFLHIGPEYNQDVLDEVDLALMEEDALTSDGVIIEAAPVPEIVVAESSETVEQDLLILPTPDPVEAVAMSDLVHEVKSNETLWDIAKATTGDANNWHIIADINNLAPDASVIPGQALTIPADMVKPDYGVPYKATVADADTTVIETPINDSQPIELAAQSETPTKERLAIPAAAAESQEITVAALPTGSETPMELNAGETLWDFSKRTTGDATNWKAIAQNNQFNEKQATMVRAGQKINVPTDWIVERDVDGLIIAKGGVPVPAADMPTKPETVVASAEPVKIETVEAAAEPVKIESAVAKATNNVPAAANPALSEEKEIKIVEAAFQSDTPIKPATTEKIASEANNALDADMGKVMVSGTYYPKAIYNDADFSSSLLMRVSPGTELVVSKAIGPWLEVRTDKGIGYVHSRDIK